MELVRKLEALSNLDGASGFEDEVRAEILNLISRYADEVNVDSFGNLYSLILKMSTEKTVNTNMLFLSNLFHFLIVIH